MIWRNALSRSPLRCFEVCSTRDVRVHYMTIQRFECGRTLARGSLEGASRSRPLMLPLRQDLAHTDTWRRHHFRISFPCRRLTSCLHRRPQDINPNLPLALYRLLKLREEVRPNRITRRLPHRSLQLIALNQGQPKTRSHLIQSETRLMGEQPQIRPPRPHGQGLALRACDKASGLPQAVRTVHQYRYAGPL